MSNAPSTDTDPWDRPFDDSRSGKAVSTRHKAVAAPSTIPDDWDAATSSGEEDNNQSIWDNANRKVPMPQLVARTGSISSVVPPASAFQTPIRILKRSSAAPQRRTSDDDAPAPDAITGTGTFAERSARYNAARERIFSCTTEAGVNAAGTTGGESGGGGGVSTIIRNPKCPEHTQGSNGQVKEGSQGFGARAGGKRATSSGQPNEK